MSQRLWLASAAALVGLLAVGGGWLVWQGLAHPAVSLRATAPAVEAHDAAVTGGWGAPELIGGVPWGFPLTPDGAAAAALTAVTVTGQPEVVFDPARFAEVAAVVFTADEAVAQGRQVDAARTEFDLSGWGRQPVSRRLYFFAPLAARLVAYNSAVQSARVEVWAMTLVGVGDAGGAVFTTSTVDLEADGATWTVTALDTVEGPTPLVQATASAPGRTRVLLRDAVAAWPLPLPVVGRQP
ncbi:MAG TPA: hypothetical protein VHF25_13530 [Nitriliruptorales bacterium]|nr:hypothetical protein [Nitriliruptorales bacterium]